MPRAFAFSALKHYIFPMMKEFISDNFSPDFCRLTSWRYLHRDFAADFAALAAAGAWSENSPRSEIIWGTRSKFVLKVVAPSGTVAVYKSFRKIASPYKYTFGASPSAREALNYQIFTDAGFPMVKLLGVGEFRGFLHLQNSFMITEFAAGFSNGRDFYGRGTRLAETELRDRFLRENIRLLAQLNDLGILHRGFTPANLLYREAPDGGLELRWIDIAASRTATKKEVRRYGAYDLFHLLRYYDFNADERQKLIKFYLDCRKQPEFTLPELVESLESELRAAQKRHNGHFYHQRKQA